MKKILIGLSIMITAVTAKAADYTISVQAVNSGSTVSLKWVVKIGSSIIATESRSKSLESVYTTSYGSVLPVNPNSNKLQITGDQISFESSDCTGTPYYQSFRPNISANRGVILRPTTNLTETKTMHSKLSNYVGEACIVGDNQISAFPMKVCSSDDCPFAVDSDITFSQQ